MHLGTLNTWISKHAFLSSGQAFEAIVGVVFLEFTLIVLFPSLLGRQTCLSRVITDSSLRPFSYACLLSLVFRCSYTLKVPGRHGGGLVAKFCQTLATLWTIACQAVCPWDFPGKNTGVSCRALLQGIFPTQGSNPGLLHCRQILYHLNHQGSSWKR